MSFSHRPRAVINGIRRTRSYRFFWCRHCDGTVRIASSPDPYRFVCPLCFNLLCQELHVSRPDFAVQGHEPNSSAEEMLDIMAEFIEPPARTTSIPNSLYTQPTWSSPYPVSQPEYALSWGENNLQQDLLPSEFEEFLPVVKVTDDILKKDSACSVCKEDFMVDEQIRKMPCCHYYHSGCITPWIRIHNTCPVCRYQIPVPQSSDNDINSSNFQSANDNVDQEGIDSFRFEEAMNLAWPSWAELVSLWPFSFGSFLNGSFQDQEDSLIDTASTRAVSSWWRYLWIL